jgi:CBS domain-containing protein
MTKLPIHMRFELGRDDKVVETGLVRCPDDGRWISAEGCKRCAKAESTDGASVTCSPDTRTREAEWPEDAPIAEVLDASVLSIDATTTAKRASELMAARGAGVAIVLDRSAHPIGVVSRGDLANASPSRRVETCMTPFLITLLDSTSVADAIEVVLERGLSHVPVLADGRVVGVVTPRTVIRWLAQKVQRLRNARAMSATGPLKASK